MWYVVDMSSVATSQEINKMCSGRTFVWGQNFEDKVLYNERYLTLERRQTATMLFEL